MIQADANAPDATICFDQAVESAFQSIRGAITELLSSVGANPAKPQEVSRQLGINKNLAWKISKIVMVPDARQMIAHLPGEGGMKAVLAAFARHGASEEVMAATRTALHQFDEMVRDQVDDRSTLQLAIASGAPEDVPPEHLHAMRKMAFQGNSAIWGLQARVRFSLFLLAPNRDDPTLIDTVSVGGLLDVRRLRPQVGVPLMTRFSYEDDGSIRVGPAPQPLVPGDSGENGLMLIPEFCSSPTPDFRAVEVDGTTQYRLSPGPIGNPGRSSWVFGERHTGYASVYRDALNTVGEHATQIDLPAQWLQCDFLAHRDLEFAQTPRVFAQSAVGGTASPASVNAGEHLPISERIQGIGAGPPIVATPLIAAYPEIVRFVYECLGWDPADFIGHRFVMKYPPMPICVVVQHDLREPAGK